MGLIGHGLVQNRQTENSDDMAYIIHKVSILANDKKLLNWDRLSQFKNQVLADKINEKGLLMLRHINNSIIYNFI